MLAKITSATAWESVDKWQSERPVISNLGTGSKFVIRLPAATILSSLNNRDEATKDQFKFSHSDEPGCIRKMQFEH
ncbi:MAG: hypothetical protein IT342_24675 [Candidatus Melainabacteria bacterium]|nr:hypothetical protein [Candidatus Melainabacteria bacterium]